MLEDKLPLGRWGEQAIDVAVRHLQLPVAIFETVVEALDGGLHNVFQLLPAPLVILVVTVVCLMLAGWRNGLFALFGLLLVWNQGLWAPTLETLSLVLTATILSLVVAIPIGIAMAESRYFAALLDPVLNLVQTMPRFVYLIPAVILLGIDVVPAVFATMTLAVPPPIRHTAVGLRAVNATLTEAAAAFGASRWQILLKVKLPLAAPSIMLGVNQCLMMSLSMAVIASLIGAGGLGSEVLTAIARLRAGDGVVAGLAIFVLAIIIDRLTRAAAARVAMPRRGRHA